MSGLWVPGNKCHAYRICHNPIGETLVEVIVALVLCLLLVESLLLLTLVGISNIVNAGQRTTACTYAESLLEEMKARPDLLQGVSVNTTLHASELAFSMPDPEDMQTTIQLLPLEGTAALCQVNVKVSIKGNRTWEENLTSLIARPQVQE